MFRVLIACAKGGVGKTTISTTLAGAWALEGRAVALVDADPQGSARIWCERRAGFPGEVAALDGTRRDWARRLPEGVERVVIDAPAGAMAKDLSRFLDEVDALVVPVLPSVLDMEATVRFLNALADVPRVASGKVPVGLVANRLKPRTQASQQVVDQLSQWPVGLVAQLRDTQAYVLLSGLGKCLFDFRSESVREHQKDWEPLLRWLKHVRKRA